MFECLSLIGLGKLSVGLVTIGAIIATLSRPSSASSSPESDDGRKYMIGVSMLSMSLLLTGTLGLLQEVTYKKYGPCWREGVFYTVSGVPLLTSLMGVR